MQYEDWLATWQRVALDTYRALISSLKQPGCVAIYGSDGKLLQIGYMSNLQKIHNLNCQFGSTLEVLLTFDPEFTIAYWVIPFGCGVESIFSELVLEISEGLPLRSRGSLASASAIRSLTPFGEDEDEAIA